MNVHAELRSFWHLFQTLRHRHTQPADQFGFGYSRTDTDTTSPAAVPNGVDLYHFTGRPRQEAHR